MIVILAFSDTCLLLLEKTGSAPGSVFWFHILWPARCAQAAQRRPGGRWNPLFQPRFLKTSFSTLLLLTQCWIWSQFVGQFLIDDGFTILASLSRYKLSISSIFHFDFFSFGKTRVLRAAFPDISRYECVRHCCKRAITLLHILEHS